MMKVFNFNDGDNYYIVAENLAQACSRYQEFMSVTATDKRKELRNINQQDVVIEKAFCEKANYSSVTTQVRIPSHIFIAELSYEDSDEDLGDVIRIENHFFIANTLNDVLDYVAGEYGHNHINAISIFEGEDDVVIY